VVEDFRPTFGAASGISMTVPNSPHLVQRPSQRNAVAPHPLQEYFGPAFAIVTSGLPDAA
jgi:hypothetical protein